MEIHQVLVSASPGDAVTNDALEIRALLRKVTKSEIYARYFHESLVDDIHPLSDYPWPASGRPHDDQLQFHASIGEPDVMSFLLERPERLIVIYHNISPSAPFLMYDAAFAGLLDGGRRELQTLAGRALLALADSSYNAGELHDLGYRDVRLSPLIIDVPGMLRLEPDEGTLNHLRTREGPVVLFVGQLLPHKRPDFLIEAYHVLVTELVPEAQLVMVGADRRLPRYVAALRTLVNELNLTQTWITGSVTAEQLVACYRGADLFVTASEHEGFCVPLLESMAFGVPALARSFGAIPETMGDGGVLLPPDAGTEVAAEAMQEMLTNQELRAKVVEAGRARVAAYSPDRARETLLRHVLSVA